MDRAEPDELTIRRAQRGDRDAQRSVFELLYPQICKHVGFLLAFRPEAEDAAQAAALEVLRALPGYRFRASLTTWGLAIATRVAFRHGKRARSIEEPVDLAEQGWAVPEGAPPADLVDLSRAMGRLSDKLREAVVLIDVVGLTAEEAGESLGVPANTAASRRRLAVEQLRRAWSEKNAPPGDESAGLRALQGGTERGG
jgi:RNA polymerase sigma-70 factor (ECF subfamily)